MQCDNSFYTISPFVGKKICVVVPHEDDEILTMGAVLPYLSMVAEVYIVITTNGDYLGKEYGMKRIEESRKALSSLGVNEEKILFLGYSDQALTNKGQSIYEAEETEPCEGKAKIKKTYGDRIGWTIGDKKISYDRFMTLGNLYRDIETIFFTLLPDYIFSIGLDGHIDHDGLSKVVDSVLKNMYEKYNYTPVVYKMLAHATYWLGSYDYTSWNNKSTVIDRKMLENLNKQSSIYNWTDRVRFPISREFSLFPTCYKFYNLLKNYKTQNAKHHFARVLNGDLIFFPEPRKNYNRTRENHIVMIKLIYADKFIYKFYSARRLPFSELKVYALYPDDKCNYIPLNDDRFEVFLDGNKVNLIADKDINVTRTGCCIKVQLKSDSAVYDQCVIKLYGVKEIILKYIEQIVLFVCRVSYKIKGKLGKCFKIKALLGIIIR
jgi:LmbE family N-acetylglucosaminyl deacetylase